jgi:choline-sulfatase
MDANLTIGRKDVWDYQPPPMEQDKYIRSHLELDELERRARYPVVDAFGRVNSAVASHHGAAGAFGE